MTIHVARSGDSKTTTEMEQRTCSIGVSDGVDAHLLFTRRYAELRRTRRIYTAVGLILFCAALIGSAVIGRFSPSALLEGAPKLGEYICLLCGHAQLSHYNSTIDL